LDQRASVPPPVQLAFAAWAAGGRKARAAQLKTVTSAAGGENGMDFIMEFGFGGWVWWMF
jgi:hypothetical protein